MNLGEKWPGIGRKCVKNLFPKTRIVVRVNLKHILAKDCYFDLYCIIDDSDWNVLAESKNYCIKGDYEETSLYRKNDMKYIASIGHFYGDPEDAYIDPKERFCITVGCGIIKYNLAEPFEGYMYDRKTTQWIETGRVGDIFEFN